MAEDLRPLASLSLTHVSYDPTDPLSYLCAWLALVPQGLCIVYVTLIWSTREIEIALLFAGQMACEALNFALKRLIKEERPARMNGKGYGMPSSHAQFVAFFGVSMVLFLLVRHRAVPLMGGAAGGSGSGGMMSADGSSVGGAAGTTGRKTLDEMRRRTRSMHTPLTLLERAGYSAIGVGVGAAVAWSRIYLNYHTERQVYVGCGAGALSAVAWFLFTEVLRRRGWVLWLLETPLVRWFRVRDLVVEEDLCQAGWEKWDDKMAAMRAEGLIASESGSKRRSGGGNGSAGAASSKKKR